MMREMINNENLDKIVGGSICVSEDRTTCGLNCTNQFKINDFSAIVSYVDEHKATMTEKEMLKAMAQLGYITRL